MCGLYLSIFSCREGLGPTGRKRRVTPAKSGFVNKPATIDQRVQTLETLHDATNVVGNLNMKKGRRIKVPALPNTRPNFDVNFVELTDTRACALDAFDTCDPDEDEDLPAAFEIMPSLTMAKVTVSSNQTPLARGTVTPVKPTFSR